MTEFFRKMPWPKWLLFGLVTTSVLNSLLEWSVSGEKLHLGLALWQFACLASLVLVEYQNQVIDYVFKETRKASANHKHFIKEIQSIRVKHEQNLSRALNDSPEAETAYNTLLKALAEQDSVTKKGD